MDNFPHKLELDYFLGALQYSILPDHVMDLLTKLKLAEQLIIQANVDFPFLITVTIMYDQSPNVMQSQLDFAHAAGDASKLSSRAEFFLLYIFFAFLRDHVNKVTELTLKGLDRKFECRFLSAFQTNLLRNIKLSTLASPRRSHLLDFHDTGEYWELEWTNKMNLPFLCPEFSRLREFTFAPRRPLNATQQANLGTLLSKMGRLESFGITQRPDSISPMFDTNSFGSIIKGLATNPLQKLLLDVSPDEMNMWTDHLHMIPGLQIVCLRSRWDMTDQTALSHFLRTLPRNNMKAIAILECPMFVPSAVEIAKILVLNKLECFGLCNSGNTPNSSINIVMTALSINQSIRKLLWKHSPIRELISSPRGKDFARVLSHHPSLRQVEIVSEELSVHDVTWICRHVAGNPVMESLTIGSCEWEIGAMQGVRYLLETSQLVKLKLVRMAVHECVMIDRKTVRELARGIAANKTLRTLHLNFYLSEKDQSLLVDAFQHNSTLTRLEGYTAALLGPACPGPTSSRLQHYLNLNRFGRKKALASDFPVEQLWPILLEKASLENLSTLFYFVQQKPCVFNNTCSFVI